MGKESEIFFTRHSIKPKGNDIESADFPGISEKGVEMAKERAKEILELLDKSAEGSVMFIAGASDTPRTGSTAEVYGEELKELAKEKEDIVVISRQEIKDEGAPEGYTKLVNKFSQIIDSNPDKKIVIDFPLFLKELSMKPWLDEKGNFSQYLLELMKKNNDDAYLAMKEWVDTSGVMENKGLSGPNPLDVAKSHKKAIGRILEFADKHIHGRPLILGMVGHSWMVDIFLAYLSSGKIDAESLEQVAGGEMIKETELASIKIENGEIAVSYRGKTFVSKEE